MGGQEARGSRRALPHEKPQLYAVDVDQSEDPAHEVAAAEPSMPTSLVVELAHLSQASGIAGGALQVQAISTFEVSDAYQCIFVPLRTQQMPAFGATGGHAPAIITLMCSVMSRRGSAHGNCHIPKNGHQANSAWHGPWCHL